MRHLNKFFLAACCAVSLAAVGCSDDDGTTNPPTNEAKAATLKGSLVNGDRTLSKDTVYTVEGFYLIQPGSKLIIPAGTTIMGDFASKGAIITVRGTSTRASGQIIAEGTAAEPIVFTSSQPVGSRARGDWGGVILSGLSDLNVPGKIGVGEGGTGAYGWGNVLAAARSDDNSGTLKYVRIEYGGTKVTPDNEINGVTFNAVGSGTTIEHVQAHMIADDGFEWFGGTVNAKYLVSSGNDDDAFDMDFGYSGKLQFLFALQDPEIANRGFEVDNDAQGSTNEPFTSATISNVTLVGTGKEKANDDDNDGIYLRRNNKLKIYNAIVTNFRYGLVIDGSGTKANAESGDLMVKNSVLGGIKGPYLYKGGTAADLDALATGWGIRSSAVNLTSIAFETPNPVPTDFSGLPAFLPINDTGFFSNVSFIGAFGPGDNWISGWTNFKKK